MLLKQQKMDEIIPRMTNAFYNVLCNIPCIDFLEKIDTKYNRSNTWYRCSTSKQSKRIRSPPGFPGIISLSLYQAALNI